MDLARLVPALIAAVAFLSLAAQTVVVARLVDGRVLILLWVMVGYFTIVANVAAGATFAAVAVRGRPASASWHGAVLAWVAVTAIVFHALLSRAAGAAGSPFGSGLGWWAAQGLHTAVPVLVLAHWIAAAPKAELGWRDAFVWLLLPLGYCGFALGQAGLSGRAVYPFLDAATLGWDGVARSVAALLGAFLALHLVIVGSGRLLTRAQALPAGAAPGGPPPR